MFLHVNTPVITLFNSGIRYFIYIVVFMILLGFTHDLKLGLTLILSMFCSIIVTLTHDNNIVKLI
jgi:hypothetical protein